MKSTLPTPSSGPPKPIKKDPFQRLSLAVKQLDQLITRAHQLGSLTDQLLREDKSEPNTPSPEIGPTQVISSNSSKKLQPSLKLSKKFEES